ncbi:DUF3658 domain-containing protein [Stenotrophomonas sp.]|uniref:DUF3658 domain-containing protein n=1 Tax=Stenotrophomonas sp. TaxID=69392 RepID=UPI0028AE86AD|nr:DUF3658 domain-containing protein [Stenotrophomonas sp.]
MQDLHIVDGDSAAGCLRHAIVTGQLSGEVFALNDWLSVGPLGSAAGRTDFLSTQYLPPPPGAGEPDDLEPGDDVFARWDALKTRFQVPGRAILWISGNASDHVLLRMACHMLEATRVKLWQVSVPAFGDWFESVATHPPEALARFAPTARPLSSATVANLAREFIAIAAHPEPVRHLDTDGTLRYRSIDLHDALLLTCCPYQWTPANYVAGNAMSRCERRNGLSDHFFAARLRALINRGQIESRTPLSDAGWDWRINVRRAGGTDLR